MNDKCYCFEVPLCSKSSNFFEPSVDLSVKKNSTTEPLHKKTSLILGTEQRPSLTFELIQGLNQDPLDDVLR